MANLGHREFLILFPLDPDHPRRDRISVMTLRTQRMKIGFTGEDGCRVEEILRERGADQSGVPVLIRRGIPVGKTVSDYIS